MKNRFLIVLFGMVFLNTTLKEDGNITAINLDIQELEMLAGKYKGTLEYLDYSDDKSRVTLNMTASFSIQGNKIKVVNVYDEGNGRTETRKGHYIIKNSQIDGITLAEKKKNRNALKLVWYEKGRDGNQNKAATFRHTFETDGEILSIRKEVLYEGESAYFTRNLTQLKKGQKRV